MSIIMNLNPLNADFRDELQHEIDKVGKEISKRTRAKFHGVQIIVDDVLDLNGKMLRPLFTIIAAHFGTYESEKMVKLAASIEILHMATLIHDDVIDESKFRRHRESVQSKYGKDMAVYSGDYLLAKTLSILDLETYDSKNVKRLVRAIEQICESELLQYQNRNHVTSFKNYLRIVAGKTAALFATSMYVGALESDCDARTARLLGRIGYELGVAFQIIDDILDFSEDASKIGKTVRNDLKKGYYTLPVIYALADEPESDLTEDEILLLIDKAKGIDRSRALARKYTKKAYKHIALLPDGVQKEAVHSMASFLLDRAY